MAKRKLKFKPRRALLRSDFRKTPKQEPLAGMILIEGDGCIAVDKINNSFPDKAERLAYIRALIIGMGGSLE